MAIRRWRLGESRLRPTAANSGHLPLSSCPLRFPAVCDGSYIEITSSGVDLNWHHSWFRCSPNEAHPFTSFSRRLFGEGAWDASRFAAVGPEVEETAAPVLGWKSSHPQILRGEFCDVRQEILLQNRVQVWALLQFLAGPNFCVSKVLRRPRGNAVSPPTLGSWGSPSCGSRLVVGCGMHCPGI